jgi:hypothetical protein
MKQTLEVELLDLNRRYSKGDVTAKFVVSEIFRLSQKYPESDIDELMQDLLA